MSLKQCNFSFEFDRLKLIKGYINVAAMKLKSLGRNQVVQYNNTIINQQNHVTITKGEY